MPYQESPYFCTPPRKKKIWRYMSLDKFMSILSSNSLYFPNIYEFNDINEGRLSELSLEEVYKTNLFNVNNTPIKQDKAFFEMKEFMERTVEYRTKEDREEMYNLLHSFRTLLYDFSNHFMFCNSWFQKDHESFTMWGEYGDKRHPTSIALQTTVGDLIDSFEYTPYDIHIGEVKYIDYREEHIEGYEHFETVDLTIPDNVLKLFYAPILHKKRIYDDEHEIRATISFQSICEYHLLDQVYTSEIPFYSDRLFKEESRYFSSDVTNLMRDIHKDGVPIGINASKLVQTIVVSPNANNYFREPLIELIVNKGLSPNIYYSDV